MPLELISMQLGGTQNCKGSRHNSTRSPVRRADFSYRSLNQLRKTLRVHRSDGGKSQSTNATCNHSLRSGVLDGNCSRHAKT